MEALADAYYASLTPEQRSALESPNNNEVESKADDDFNSDLPF
jgi:hypothetical protein